MRNFLKGKLSEFQPDGDAKALEELTDDFKQYQLICSAIDLGLFDFLKQEGPADKEKISQKLKINGMFVRSYLKALEEAGFLNQRDGIYDNSKLSNTFFLSDEPGFRGDWFKTVSSPTSRWMNLVKTLTQETPAKDNFFAGPDKSFIYYLAQRCMNGELQAVVKAITSWKDFSSKKTVLDIGGGHGLYAISLCQNNPEMTAAVFDKPFIIPFTEEFIQAYEMEDRISVIGGDIVTDEIPEEYDIILISDLLYKFRKDLPSIFERVYRALKPGGLFVSNHWFCEPGCINDKNGITELDRSMQSFGHPLCHIETFHQFFEEQGFSILKEEDVPTDFGISKLHLAIKSR